MYRFLARATLKQAFTKQNTAIYRNEIYAANLSTSCSRSIGFFEQLKAKNTEKNEVEENAKIDAEAGAKIDATVDTSNVISEIFNSFSSFSTSYEFIMLSRSPSELWVPSFVFQRLWRVSLSFEFRKKKVC